MHVPDEAGFRPVRIGLSDVEVFGYLFENSHRIITIYDLQFTICNLSKNRKSEIMSFSANLELHYGGNGLGPLLDKLCVQSFKQFIYSFGKQPQPFFKMIGR